MKHITEIRNKTLDNIEKRRAGKVISFKTPFPKLNKKLINGIDYGSLILLGGKSGAGKTAVADQIVSNNKERNGGKEVPILKFQFEMTDEQTGVRELTAVTQLSMQQLYSAEEGFTLDDYHIETIKAFYEKNKDEQIWQISESKTTRQFEAAVIEFYKKVNTPFIVYLDHSILTNKSADEASTLDTLYSLCKVTNRLKKVMPVIFIILTQMNRSLDDISRRENGRSANFPTKSDIFGGDALYQFADVVLILMRPAADGIQYYGPTKYIVDKSHIIMHILKNRWGNPHMLFFEEDLKHFRIKECAPPNQQS